MKQLIKEEYDLFGVNTIKVEDLNKLNKIFKKEAK